MEEEFKKIEGYENYEISNLGNVRNIDTGRFLKPSKNNGGYYHLNLNKNGTIRKLTYLKMDNILLPLAISVIWIILQY